MSYVSFGSRTKGASKAGSYKRPACPVLINKSEQLVIKQYAYIFLP